MKGVYYCDRKTGELKQEVVPGESWLNFLYHNPLGKLALSALVKRKFLTQCYGGGMDLPKSKSRIAGFVDSLKIDMSEALLSQDDFQNFNEFFIRELKPEARPINNDPNVIVSPADGRVMVFRDINQLDTFFAKGQDFSLQSFLKDESLAEKYIDGSMVIFRLAPVDYHRFHFPADGEITESKLINGNYYSVSPYAVKNRLSIYWENKREYSVLKKTVVGDILLCEVGATMVGSIVQNYKPNSLVNKGQEKGYFKFGGSTVVALFEKGKLQIDDDVLQNMNKGYETIIKMGERLGCAL